MVLVHDQEQVSVESIDHEDHWPAEVDFVISALDAGPRPVIDRRGEARLKYRAKARLRLFSDEAAAPAWVLYTRHISTRGMGFISARPLPLSHGGVMEIRSPDGKAYEIFCTVLRCRETSHGWYEGAVYFNREQPAFSAAAQHTPRLPEVPEAMDS